MSNSADQPPTILKWSVVRDTRGERPLDRQLLGERLFQLLWTRVWEVSQTELYASLERSFHQQCGERAILAPKTVLSIINATYNYLYNVVRRRFEEQMWPALRSGVVARWEQMAQPREWYTLEVAVALHFEFTSVTSCGAATTTLNGVFSPGRMLQLHLVFTNEPDEPFAAQ